MVILTPGPADRDAERRSGPPGGAIQKKLLLRFRLRRQGQKGEPMSQMSKSELIVLLELLADLIEAKAKTPEEAAKIIRDKLDQIKKH